MSEEHQAEALSFSFSAHKRAPQTPFPHFSSGASPAIAAAAAATAESR